MVVNPWEWADTGAWYGDIPDRGRMIALRPEVVTRLRQTLGLRPRPRTWRQAMAWEQLAHEYTHSLGHDHPGQGFGGGPEFERMVLANLRVLADRAGMPRPYADWLVRKARTFQSS